MRIGPNRYSGWIGVSGEGHRFAVMTCLDCGAAVLYGTDEDSPKIHDGWHARTDKTDHPTASTHRATDG